MTGIGTIVDSMFSTSLARAGARASKKKRKNEMLDAKKLLILDFSAR
jgi:hypothetical protein